MEEPAVSLAHPALNPPRLPSPRRRGQHSRSPIQSPMRHRARDWDPLLRDLSPTTTLRAFSSDDRGLSRNSLSTSFENASPSQRILGAKAAKTCLDVRSWARELGSWDWPGTFEEPEPARKRRRTMGNETSYGHGSLDINQGGEEYWGCLPTELVRTYERRVDEISQDLGMIDVEELKGFALSAHQQVGSGSMSMDNGSAQISSTEELHQLDDFTAVVTATILQTLPYLSRLNRLLSLWTMRLSILRQTSRFLDDLDQVRNDLDQGWSAIAVKQDTDSVTGATQPGFNRGRMIETQSLIGAKLSSLGVRLDGFLDDLEGREETVPDSWIDDFELLEHRYAEWVVQAEKTLLDGHLRESKRRSMLSSIEIEQGLLRHMSARSNRSSPSLLIEDGNISANQSGGNNSRASLAELARADSGTLPNFYASRVLSSDRATTSSVSSDRSRHVPIVVPYVGDGQEYPAEGVTGDTFDTPNFDAPSPLPSPATGLDPKEEELPAFSIKKRTAFLKANIEASSSLQKQVASPVRSFEHASNAFTRLFKKENSPLQPARDFPTTSSAGPNTQSRRTMSLQTGGVSRNERPRTMSQNGRTNEAHTPHMASGETLDDVELGPGLVAGSSQWSSDNPGKREAIPETVAAPLALPEEQSDLSYFQPSRPTVETYKPTGLPARSQTPPKQEFPENWPLQSPDVPSSKPDKHLVNESASGVGGYSPAMASPKLALDSDKLEHMFVDGLTASSIGRSFASPERTQDTSDIQDDSESKFILPPDFVKQPHSEENVFLQEDLPDPDEAQTVEGPEADVSFVHTELEKPTRIDLPPATSSLSIPLDSSEDKAMRKSFDSDMSSPEVKHASIGYFQLPPSISRRSSLVPIDPSSLSDRRKSEPALSHKMLKLKIPLSPSYMPSAADPSDPTQGSRPSPLKRASVASMEWHTRSEVKSIDIPRRSSFSPASPVNQTPRDLPASPMSFAVSQAFPTPTNGLASEPRSPVSPIHLPDSPVLGKRTRDLMSSPLTTSPESSPTSAGGPLNALIMKRRGKGKDAVKTTPHKTIAVTSSPRREEKKLLPGEDLFDRHVSEVLESIPAPIRFSSSSGPETSSPHTTERRNLVGTKARPSPRVLSRGNGMGMTIAPAGPSHKKSASNNEPDVKLYHLTQAGREEPIKLFVRLVGEGERVMVRVGGGWADLADYLRQYAEHHGSRTVSQGQLQVETASSTPTNGFKGRRASGLAASEVKAKSTGTPTNANSRTAELSTPQHNKNIDGSPVSAATAEENTSPSRKAAPTPLANTTSTPKSSSRPSTASRSRPSTAETTSSPSSQQKNWNEVGMAGQQPKKGELVGDKAKWVEGMLEKARKASAEKGKEDKAKHFNELSKVGKTRRMIFRSASSQAMRGGGGGETGGK